MNWAWCLEIEDHNTQYSQLQSHANCDEQIRSFHKSFGNWTEVSVTFCKVAERRRPLLNRCNTELRMYCGLSVRNIIPWKLLLKNNNCIWRCATFGVKRNLTKPIWTKNMFFLVMHDLKTHFYCASNTIFSHKSSSA